MKGRVKSFCSAKVAMVLRNNRHYALMAVVIIVWNGTAREVEKGIFIRN